MAPVYQAQDEMEAEVVREVLESAGIPVLLTGGASSVYPVSIGPWAGESIAVPESRLEEAREVLRQALQSGEEAFDDFE